MGNSLCAALLPRSIFIENLMNIVFRPNVESINGLAWASFGKNNQPSTARGEASRSSIREPIIINLLCLRRFTVCCVCLSGLINDFPSSARSRQIRCRSSRRMLSNGVMMACSTCFRPVNTELMR